MLSVVVAVVLSRYISCWPVMVALETILGCVDACLLACVGGCVSADGSSNCFNGWW
jgi:hypothetical protein